MLNLTLNVPADATATGYTRLQMVGTQDKPAWVASDLGAILKMTNIRATLALFDDDEKGVNTVYTPGGKQSVSVVYEAGLYRLLFTSRVPAAKTFRRWVLHEVLPCIRKHGCYPAPPPDPKAMPAGTTSHDLLPLLADGQTVIAQQLVESNRLIRELIALLPAPEVDGIADAVARRLEPLFARLNQPALPPVTAKRITNKEKSQAAREELLRDPTRTDQWIGTDAGVDRTTVARIRRQMEDDGELERCPLRTDRNGRIQVVKNQNPMPSASRN